MSEERERTIHIILGAPGSGKTTLLRALIAQLRAQGSTARILDPKRQLGGEWPGTGRAEEWITKVLERNELAINAQQPTPTTLVVADDSDLYVPKYPKPDSMWRELYIANRHYDVDAIVTARRPQALSLELLSASDYLWCFRMSPADVRGIAKLREYIPNFPVPTQKYVFVRVNLFEGICRVGSTSREGTYAVGEAFIP